MGVNAQTAVPEFQALEVLTAAEMTQINTGIPVFATTVTRDAAFGGAGEKVLAEGQFAYIEATNTTQYYDGAAWQSVGTTPGLVYITGATFTGVATVDSPQNTFTSTYTNYLVSINLDSAASAAALYFRLSTTGTPVTTGYDWAGMTVRSTTATFPGGQNNVAQFYFGDVGNIDYTSFVVTLANPQVSAKVTKTTWAGPHADGTYYYSTTGAGRQSPAASHDGFRIFNSGGVNMTGSYKVYGYSNS
jgi:hypothetical protein